MNIIQMKAYENGYRPPIQTWDEETLPAGYLWCPEEFERIFYSTSPAGFVTIAHDGETVTAMTINEEALAAYLASLPQAQDPAPTTEDVLNTLLGVKA